VDDAYNTHLQLNEERRMRDRIKYDKHARAMKFCALCNDDYTYCRCETIEQLLSLVAYQYPDELEDILHSSAQHIVNVYVQHECDNICDHSERCAYHRYINVMYHEIQPTTAWAMLLLRTQ